MTNGRFPALLIFAFLPWIALAEGPDDHQVCLEVCRDADMSLRYSGRSEGKQWTDAQNCQDPPAAVSASYLSENRNADATAMSRPRAGALWTESFRETDEARRLWCRCGAGLTNSQINCFVVVDHGPSLPCESPRHAKGTTRPLQFRAGDRTYRYLTAAPNPDSSAGHECADKADRHKAPWLDILGRRGSAGSNTGQKGYASCGVASSPWPGPAPGAASILMADAAGPIGHFASPVSSGVAGASCPAPMIASGPGAPDPVVTTDGAGSGAASAF